MAPIRLRALHTTRAHKSLTGMAWRRYRQRMTGAQVVACLTLLAAAAGCGRGVESAASHQTSTYPLPDNGWKAGNAALLARVQGPFHAQMTTRGACATIGKPDAPISYRWPAGYRVRFHPTELIDPHGNVVAGDGDEVRSAGGLTGVVPGGRQRPTQPLIDTWCGKPGDSVFDVQGEVTPTGR